MSNFKQQMLDFLLTPVQRNFILQAVEAHTNEIVEELFGEESTPTQEELEEIRELEELR